MKRSIHIPDPAQEPDSRVSAAAEEVSLGPAPKHFAKPNPFASEDKPKADSAPVPAVDPITAPAPAFDPAPAFEPAPEPIPIPEPTPDSEPIIPEMLSDDPVIGDGSSARRGVEMSRWRVHRLKSDELVDVVEPGGRGWRARKARRAHAASKKARSTHKRVTRGRVRVLVALLFVAAAIGVVYAGVTYSLEMWGGKTVPNVVGIAQAKAQETLAQKGFEIEVDTILDDTTEGHVVFMEPGAGDRVPNGTLVHLTVAQSRVIPEVEGLPKQEAAQMLAEVGGTNIRYEWRDVLEEKDTVLEVRPPAGSVFMSSDEIVLVVSQRPTVPNVVGMTEYEAREALANAEFSVEYDYEECDADQRLVVLSTDPAADEPVSDSGMRVHVGDPLIEVLRLADYFDAKGDHIEEYLKNNEFERDMGAVSEDDHISARYTNKEKDLIAFVSDPWSHKVENAAQGNNDVMDEGAKVEGVRFSTTFVSKESSAKSSDKKSNASATGSTESGSNRKDESNSESKTAEKTQFEPKFLLDLENPTVGKSTATDVMERCAFSGIEGSCTQNDITLPKGTPNNGHNFYCCFGEVGSYIWTVLVQETRTVAGNKGIKVVATCAPKAVYNVIDLSAFGGKICDFVAYWDEYAN